MVTQKPNWLKQNLPMIAAVGSLVATAYMAVKVGELADRLNQQDEATGWVLDEVIELGQDVKDLRDELDER